VNTSLAKALSPTLDAVWTAPVQQAVYRHLLHAMGYPGSRCRLAVDLAGSSAAVATLASVVDQSVALCDLHHLLDERTLRFLGCSPAPIETAAYVLADGARAVGADLQPDIGTMLVPEAGATLVLQLGPGGDALEMELTGPGIPDSTRVAITGLDPSWIVRRAAWCAGYPRGVDLLLCDADSVLALPRTTRITMGGG